MENVKHLFKSFSLAAALIIAFVVYGVAQKRPVKTSTQPDRIGQFVKKSGYKYQHVEKGIWTLASDSGTVLVATGEGIVVVFMTVAENGDYRTTVESLTEILRLSNELDHVKFLIDDDGSIVVRADARLKSVDQAVFDDTVVRIINGYEKSSAKLSPFLVNK